ncbi:uncharacterized protein MYCFIDRAFT_151750 [Pseudocercospora fijiensis CIRAD86]|uniref:F-box domain-containing protein n=1 Tax=Pseudocercospora fijiensis (strain CIRAD86) TaxID=383855 RepID=M3AQ41_PSEFD|nr:uncharacterized protein MYCFIDRAFT_151750 [Pseudocercospora fijiensis CIRAD86]EME86716.1 hypothetical protein MYCFIDRAFT_151750 [Pseudocercospora fijiensis CIRAD86]
MSLQETSLLLNLPSELRNQIYEELLILKNHENQRNPRIHANILPTCHKIHAEATPILYTCNTFLAHPTLLAALPRFLLDRLTLTPLPLPITHARVAKLIKRFFLHVRLDTDPRFSKTQATESFSGVEELEIEVFQSSYGTCDFGVLRLFEGIRGVGRARVQGSVGDGGYARWLERSMMSGWKEEVRGFEEEFVGGDRAWDAWTHGNR